MDEMFFAKIVDGTDYSYSNRYHFDQLPGKHKKMSSTVEKCILISPFCSFLPGVR
jgi:hypothetical protein